MGIKIQIDGKTVHTIEGQVRELKIRGSKGGIAIIDGIDLKRINIIPEMLTGFNNPLEYVEESVVSGEPTPVEEEKEKPDLTPPQQLTIDSEGNEVDENADNPDGGSL